MCEAKHLAVRQFSSQLTFHLVQILNLLWRECQTFLLVVFLQILDVENRGGLDIHREDVLVQTLVHALKHGVVLGILAIDREILLDALHAFDGHVLGDFHRVRAPRRDHLTAWAYKETLQIVLVFWTGFAIQPAKPLDFISGEFVVHLSGNHTLRWCSEKVNHKVICMRIWVQRYDFFTDYRSSTIDN